MKYPHTCKTSFYDRGVCLSSRICQTTSSSASGGSSFSRSWMTSFLSTLLWQCQTDTETATNLTSLSRFSLSLSQLTEIMQLMNAYFSAIRRQRGKGEDVDITIAESTEVGFHHLGSTPTPTLLELPSHPVWEGPIPGHPRTPTVLLHVAPMRPSPSPQDPAPPPLGTARQPKQREGCFRSPSVKINPHWALQLKELADAEGRRGREGKGFCFASEARNPQKPMRLLMRCHTPPTPSCHATTSVTLHGNTPYPHHHPTPLTMWETLVWVLLHQGEIAS